MPRKAPRPRGRVATKPARTRKPRASAAQPHEEPLFVEAGPINWEATVSAFIKRHVEAAGAKGVVLGVSGGLDSAVVAALCVKALGKSKVVPVLMPAADSAPLDAKHGKLVCDWLGLRPLQRSIAPVVEGIVKTLGGKPDARTLGNAKSRSRGVTLYAIAQTKGFLVCGTGNKSELLAGYFTKWGDGASDLQPIGDLYKTQVRKLAKQLGVPRPIQTKAPTAGLRPGQTDEGDMGVSYEELDAVLKGIELNHQLTTVARKSGVPFAKVEKINGMVRSSEHKRHMPLIPKIGARTVGIDWRRPIHWDG